MYNCFIDFRSISGQNKMQNKIYHHNVMLSKIYLKKSQQYFMRYLISVLKQR